MSFYKIAPHSNVPGSHLSSDVQNNGHGNVCPWEKHAGCWPILSRPVSPHQAEIINGTSTGDDRQATVQCIKPSICLHWLRWGTSPRYHLLGEQASSTCLPAARGVTGEKLLVRSHSGVWLSWNFLMGCTAHLLSLPDSKVSSIKPHCWQAG